MLENILVEHSEEVFDAIVVGSGITGGWAAKELTKHGLKTLMVERGPIVEHRKDYITEGKPPWEYDFRTKMFLSEKEEHYPVQQQCYAFHEGTKHFFAKDSEYPYQHPPQKPFSWIRGNQLGGKSLLWHRQSYRWSKYDFETNAQDGEGTPWPIGYKDLEKWYAYVEKFVGIAGSMEGLEQLPDGIFQPPFDLTAPEKHFAQKMSEAHPHAPVIISRCAHLTAPQKVHTELGRVRCMARDECQKGCSFGAYFSTQSATLPAAVNTGLLRIAPNSIVDSLIYDASSKKVRGVRVVDSSTLKQKTFLAKMVFLCASTLGTTQVLLNSKSASFPTGLANSSGMLGKNLMDHNYNAVVWADVEGFKDEYYRGRRPASFYIPNTHYEKGKYHKNFKRGFAFAGSAAREDWQSLGASEGLGLAFKEKIKHAGGWKISMQAQGEMLPREENQVVLSHDKKDKWGIPQLDINCEWSANEINMMEYAAEVGKQYFTDAGFTNVGSRPTNSPPGLAIHEVGTARMGADRKTSVLNAFNQAHDINNLFVTDGASFCSTGVVNPSMTFMALTARAVDYAVSEFRQGRI